MEEVANNKESIEFCTCVRRATRKIHSLSDALVNAKFALSLGDETVWANGLYVFYHVFSFLEEAHNRLNLPEYKKLFVHPVLFRKQAFEEDLEHYLGENWRSTPISPELKQYLAHLSTLEKEQPLMLSAYVYHLYLGLLSGGQILSKKRKMFRKDDTYLDKTTDFKDHNIPELKTKMRTALNEIAQELSEEWRQSFLRESDKVFVLNNLIVGTVEGQSMVIKKFIYKYSFAALIVAGVIIAVKSKFVENYLQRFFQKIF